MVIAVGLSSYNIALFHLVNHAFYKGLLFLGAGAVIHAVADNQDFRKYGALLTFLPLTYTVMLIASLSLVAFPFMTGFYSKDLILETSFGLFNYSSFAVYFIAVIGAVFTTLYSVKVLYLTFITNPNGSLVSYKNAHEGDIFMSLPLVILALASISFGFFTSDIFKGLGSTPFADNSLFIHPSHEIMLNTEFGVTTLFKLLPFMLTIVSILISTYLLEILPRLLIYFKSSRFGYNLFNFFSLRFLVEFIYNRLIVRSTLNFGGQTTKLLDKGSVELVGPFGIEKRLLKLSDMLNKLDTGIITSYALYILIGLILYMLLPYVFYYNFSLLLLVIYGLYLITEDNKNKRYTLVSIPKAHSAVNLPLSSNFFSALLNNKWIKRLTLILITGIIFFFICNFIIYYFELDNFNNHTNDSDFILYYSELDKFNSHTNDLDFILYYFELDNFNNHKDGSILVLKEPTDPPLDIKDLNSTTFDYGSIKIFSNSEEIPKYTKHTDDSIIIENLNIRDTPRNTSTSIWKQIDYWLSWLWRRK